MDNQRELEASRLHALLVELGASAARADDAMRMIMNAADGYEAYNPDSDAETKEQLVRLAKAYDQMTVAFHALNVRASTSLIMAIGVEHFRDLTDNSASIREGVAHAANEFVSRRKTKNEEAHHLFERAILAFKQSTGAWPATTRDAEGCLVSPLFDHIGNLISSMPKSDDAVSAAKSESMFLDALRNLKNRAARQSTQTG